MAILIYMENDIIQIPNPSPKQTIQLIKQSPVSMASGLPIEAIASYVASKLSIQEITSSAASDCSVQEDLDMESESESEDLDLTDLEMASNSTVQKDPEFRSFNTLTLYYTKEGKLIGSREEDDSSSKQHPVIRYSSGTEGVTMSGPPILPTDGFTRCYGPGLYLFPDDEHCDFRMLDYMGEVTERFCELIKRAPNRTVDFIKAGKDLGVRGDLMYRLKYFLVCNKAIVEEEPNKIRWVFDYPPPEDIKQLRHLRDLEKHRRFEKLVRSMSEEKNGRKRNWRWLFLTEADINDFVINDSVGFQNDIFMIVHCPRDINLGVPRPAQDGDGQQRKYGIIGKIFPSEGMVCYFVSKLESHDVVNLDEASRSYPSSSEG